MQHLTVPAEEEQTIGIWGQRHLDYLKQHRRVTYINLLTSGRGLNLCRFFGNLSVCIRTFHITILRKAV